MADIQTQPLPDQPPAIVLRVEGVDPAVAMLEMGERARACLKLVPYPSEIIQAQIDNIRMFIAQSVPEGRQQKIGIINDAEHKANVHIPKITTIAPIFRGVGFVRLDGPVTVGVRDYFDTQIDISDCMGKPQQQIYLTPQFRSAGRANGVGEPEVSPITLGLRGQKEYVGAGPSAAVLPLF